jgi:methylamine dehydrogenase light chain
MKDNSWFDSLIESSSRTFASRSSRRSFIARLGIAMAGAAALPLLPVARLGRAEAAEAAPAETWNDPKTCDYWAYCATDGWLCTACGGTSSKCPPGTELSPIAWVGTCKNPGDGKSYVVAYHDCCGKSQCENAYCNRNEGDMPRYRPQRSNAITWCFGGVSSTYNCTISRLMSIAK